MSDDVAIELGRRLKACREAAGLTQADLAALSLKSVETISNFERGKTLPSVRTLHVLAQHMGCSVADLFSDSVPRVEDPFAATLVNRSRLLSDRDKALLTGFLDLLVANSRRGFP